MDTGEAGRGLSGGGMFGIAEGFSCGVVPGTMGGPRHGKAETALRAAPAGRGDSTRLTRLCSLSAGPSADTQLVLCHCRCVLCSPLTKQRLLVSRGREVVWHRGAAACMPVSCSITCRRM